LPKIAQLVADARTELNRLGIDTDGKRSDELLRIKSGRYDWLIEFAIVAAGCAPSMMTLAANSP
jgi:hypothetical protein